MSGTTLHIVQRMAPGGLEALVLKLAGDLGGGQYVVSLEGDAGSFLAAWPRLKDVAGRFEALGKPDGICLSLLARLVRLMRRVRPRTVVTHHIGPLLYGGTAARMAGVPELIHVEHDGWHYGSRQRRWLGCATINALNPHLVAISPTVADKLRRLCFRRQPLVIANGVDTGHFAPRSRAHARDRLGLPQDTYVIGSAGRLEYEKGHDVLIEAFARLPDQPLLVIAGTGTQRDALNALAKSRGVEERVRFLGHRDDLAEIYPAFDLFCLPSRMEGLPFAVLEAQAAGVPTVASDVGGVSAAVCPRSGATVPPQDPDALAAALERQRRSQCSASPRSFIAANYDWPHTLTQYADLIES